MKRVLCFVLSICMFMTLVPVMCFADDVVANGTCGYSAFWSLDENGLLNISGNGSIYDYNCDTQLAPWNEYSGSITEIKIDSNISIIGSYSFYNLVNLCNISIPNGVRVIGDNAFNGCKSLQSISIPKSVSKIEYGSFTNCESLSNVDIANGVKYIEDNAFYNCDSLINVIIPNSVIEFGLYVFADCDNLKSVILSNQQTVIPQGTFANCSKMQSVTIPEGISEVGMMAFHNCSSLQTVNMPSTINTIKSAAFYHCESLTSIDLPNRIYEIGNGAFNGCTKLKEVSLSASITKIEDDLFNSCSSIEKIVIPDSVTTIGKFAFYDCNSLNSVTFGNNLSSIDTSAFYCCGSLKDVYYDGNDTQWSNVNIMGNNEPIVNANKHFLQNSEQCNHMMIHVAAKEAKCESWYDAEGNIEYWYCENCGEYFSDENAEHKIERNDIVINAKEHWVSSGTSRIANSDVQQYAYDGTHHWMECKYCGFSFPGTYSSHLYVTYVTKPTCTTEGYTIHKCICGNEYIDTYVSALGHSFVNGTCTRCGTIDTTHTHNYEETIIPPTCTTEGYTIHKCICGNEYIDTYVSALGHSFVNGTCTRCGAIDEDYIPILTNPFSDVQEGTVYYDAVLWAVDKGITGGVTPTTFCPNNPCTRGQVVTFLWRAAGCPEVEVDTNTQYDTLLAQAMNDLAKAKGTRVLVYKDGQFVYSYDEAAAAEAQIWVNYYKQLRDNVIAIRVLEQNPFVDVSVDSPYYKAIIWAVQKGITNGIDSMHFEPNTPVSRAQFVTFLWRAAGKPTSNATNPFVDVSNGSVFCKAILWAVDNGVTNGYGNGLFKPNQTCTRWQVVLFMNRYSDNPADYNKGFHGGEGLKPIAEGDSGALLSAKLYLRIMAFSHAGLVEQLQYDGFSKSESYYAANNCGADWYEQALWCALEYLDCGFRFTRQELIDQLEYEGFTHDQAIYAVDTISGQK